VNQPVAVDAHYALPPSLAPFAGAMMDLDAHECTPVNRWTEEFGSEVQDFVDAVTYTPPGQAPLIFNPTLVADDAEINAHNVFNLKMERAPGAFDLKRRIEVMDFIGIRRQIMYPGGLGLLGSAFLSKADDARVMVTITGDRKRYAQRLLILYNEWVARLYGAQDRLRPVAILLGDTVDELHDNLKGLIDKGVRLFQIAVDEPPAGLSPADPRLDKVWSLANAAGVALLGHIGASENLFKTLVWRDAPAFKGWMVGGEFSLDPWTLSNIHIPVQNFLTTMILGGVFDRHPNLKFGTAEFTGHWVGPFAENMDQWYKNTPFPSDVGEKILKLEPSEYVRRNVRVACFDFEHVGDYINRYPWVADVLCFATDFPHFEGGKRPLENFAKSLEGQSPEILRKFFVDNGRFLLAD
jgi:predicted TIM-barrel fold metal-dependent hydrolase